MDLNEALKKLEELKVLYKADGAGHHDRDRACELYGELEEVITQCVGLKSVVLETRRGQEESYTNHIAAGLLGSRTFYANAGYNELLKVIGKVRQQSTNPNVPQMAPSSTNVIQTLQRFRECCQYIQQPPENERDVQDIVWIMLRSQFDRLERESALPKFGVKSSKPDFGIPDLKVLIEVKFIGDKSDVGAIQEEVLADIPAYTSGTHGYTGVIVLVYDAAQKLRDAKPFIDALESCDGIIKAIIVPGIG